MASNESFFNKMSIYPTKILYRLPIAIMLAILVSIVISCKGNQAIDSKLNDAEEVMNQYPDSALTILRGIDKELLKSKQEQARYALLMSMALDKNYIDTTSFDVLQPAIDYYLEHGTFDDQLRTYYYQGRIFQNIGDDDSAMRSFINGYELRNSITDSLLLAHTLVAQGTLYFKQYKINEFLRNNIEAAKLYGAIGLVIQEIKSYTNALDGYVMLNNKSAADSILSICLPLVHSNSDGEAYLFPSILSYTVEFCSNYEIKAFLDEYQNLDLTKDEIMNFAYGYSKIGECDKALNLLTEIESSSNCLDSLKYISVKMDILEKLGKYEQALNLYREYSIKLERYQSQLLSQDLLFSEKKHELEMKRLIDIQDRDRIILGTVCSIFGLVILVGLLFYRGYRSKTKRIIAEKENENLKLEQKSLRNEKEKAELERVKKTLEAENLEKDKRRLESEQREQELITANLKLEIAQLESERDNLKELQREQTELAKPIQNVILNRLELLNGLLAKEITQNESYAKPYKKWIETVLNDRNMFMNSTRLAFTASHPKFMEYLEDHKLTDYEINYLCLYAIGLKGKEVGNYMQLRRHYNISSEIRRKLGIDEHETNIGIYVRKLLKKL